MTSETNILPPVEQPSRERIMQHYIRGVNVSRIVYAPVDQFSIWSSGLEKSADLTKAGKKWSLSFQTTVWRLLGDKN